MTKVVALRRGFYGGKVREEGEKFDWASPPIPKWVRVLDGGPLDHDKDGKPGGSLPGEQSTVRRGRRKAETAEPIVQEPVRAVNQIEQETLSVQPDWIPADPI